MSRVVCRPIGVSIVERCCGDYSNKSAKIVRVAFGATTAAARPVPLCSHAKLTRVENSASIAWAISRLAPVHIISIGESSISCQLRRDHFILGHGVTPLREVRNGFDTIDRFRAQLPATRRFSLIAVSVV
jgi:hypothetical protein